MRADRLVATLLLLQRRKRVTAAEVAAELEVSERTARRDLEALSAAGIPVYSQQGRGGGWALVGGARTDLSGLTATEARALFLVAGPSASATPELKAALRKLVHALPEPFRVDAESAASLDHGGPGRLGAGPPDGPAPSSRGPAGGDHHRSAGQARLRRAVTARPRRGSSTPSGWWSRRRSGTSSPVPTRACGPSGSTGSPTSERPTIRWSVRPTSTSRRRGRTSGWPSTSSAPRSMSKPWPSRRSSRCCAGCSTARSTVGTAGRTAGSPITIGGHRVEIIAAQLAGFGARVEVTAPARAVQLAEIGQELCAAYGGSGERLVGDGQ